MKRMLNIGDYFTLEDFIEEVENGSINSHDGIGYLCIGNEETDVSVWNDTIPDEDYDGVMWYNK